MGHEWWMRRTCLPIALRLKWKRRSRCFSHFTLLTTIYLELLGGVRSPSRVNCYFLVADILNFLFFYGIVLASTLASALVLFSPYVFPSLLPGYRNASRFQMSQPNLLVQARPSRREIDGSSHRETGSSTFPSELEASQGPHQSLKTLLHAVPN